MKKKQKQLMILLVIKLLIIAPKFQEIHHSIIQKQLQINIIKKYSRKIYIPKTKTENYCWSKIIYFWSKNSNIIMKYQKIINLLDNTPNQPS